MIHINPRIKAATTPTSTRIPRTARTFADTHPHDSAHCLSETQFILCAVAKTSINTVSNAATRKSSPRPLSLITATVNTLRQASAVASERPPMIIVYKVTASGGGVSGVVFSVEPLPPLFWCPRSGVAVFFTLESYPATEMLWVEFERLCDINVNLLIF